MSIQDTATKQYVSEAEVFADAFNYLIYDGEQVIKPEQLTDMDTTQYVIPYHEDEKGKPEAAQKYRDTLKTLAVKTDDRYTYLVLGIENQSHVHYAMPVRNMLYDAMQLEKQVRDLASQHRKEGKNRHIGRISFWYEEGRSAVPRDYAGHQLWRKEMGCAAQPARDVRRAAGKSPSVYSGLSGFHD